MYQCEMKLSRSILWYLAYYNTTLFLLPQYDFLTFVRQNTNKQVCLQTMDNIYDVLYEASNYIYTHII